jgi:hypothetical protein
MFPLIPWKRKSFSGSKFQENLHSFGARRFIAVFTKTITQSRGEISGMSILVFN